MHQYYLNDKELTYDGTQLSSLFTFRRFGIQGDSIVGFTGSCKVELTELVDIQDVRENAPIYSDKMLHFIIEHFESSLTLITTRQRLFMAIIKELLESTVDSQILRKGDDLFVNDGKLSVSIATVSPVSGLIHAALNITNEGTPIKTACLNEIGVYKIEHFAGKVMERYKEEVISIKNACCKVRGVN